MEKELKRVVNRVEINRQRKQRETEEPSIKTEIIEEKQRNQATKYRLTEEKWQKTEETEEKWPKTKETAKPSQS